MTFPGIYNLTLLTPLFSRGSYDATAADSAEIRAPSVRGQLHHWLRQLNYGADIERAIFGAVQKGFGGDDKPSASKIVIRVAKVAGEKRTPPTLPHKQGGYSSPKAAYSAGTTFELHVLERLGGLPPLARAAFTRTLETWLVAGALGLRSTRGGGAFQWEQAPSDAISYSSRLETLLRGAPLRVAILDRPFDAAEQARAVITDTISHQALAFARFPLGAVKQGWRDNSGAPARKTSPLRFTIRRIAGRYHIIALWDARSHVTGNSVADLRKAIEVIANGTGQSQPKRIGQMLRESALYLP